MLASTFMDMVLGVDIHFEMVPMPAPVPTPLPNPFVGVVWDPAGLLTGQAMGLAMALLTGKAPTGPVFVNCMPATVCGTNAKNSLGVPHILMPPGTAWAPMPKLPKPAIKGPPPPPGPPVAPEGDAISVFGSKTVNFMGSSAVRMGDLSMSCGEPVRLPSSTVLAIPKGMPVMVGGPPALSISDAIGALLKSKWIAGYLHDLLSRMAPGRLRDLLSKAICFLTGHPVDVATGRVLTDHVDFELPGPLPLKFERNYSSSWANRAGPLGHGWSHTLDQAVWAERGRIVYLDAEGRELEFDTFDFPDHVLPSGASVFEPINRLTLKSLGQRRYEITTPDGTTSTFEPVAGATRTRRWWSRLVTRTTRAGATIALEYDGEANLAWVHDSAARQIAFEHDRAGRLVTVKLPHPTQSGWQVHTSYAYDDDGDLTRVTDPLGHSWVFAYKQHLLVKETNRNGLSFYFAYDGHGEDAYCIRTWGDGGIYDHILDYDKVGKVTCVTNSVGHTTMYKMNVVGCVTEVMNPLGAVRKFEYDEQTLRKVKEIDPTGGESSWTYDARGNCTRAVAPDGATVAVDFSDRNQPVMARDPVEGEWQWGYDHLARLAGRIDPLGRRVRFEWQRERSGRGELTAIIDPAGQRTELGYDEQANLVQLRTPDGQRSTWQYDNLGRCIAVSDHNGNVQRRERDLLGRVLRVTDPDGTVRQLSYDAEGNVTRVRDRHRDVQFSYAGMNKMISRAEVGTIVHFRYDTEERLVAVVNQHGDAYRFELDPAGRPETEVEFDGRRRTYARDPAGRVIKVFRPDARVSEFAYDDAGRLAQTTHDEIYKETFAYRADGLMVQASNDTATVKLERDLLGNIMREVAGDDWVSSTYDLLGSRVRIRSSRGLDQRITRDAVGRATAVNARNELDEPMDERHSAGEREVWTARMVRDQMGLEVERDLPGGVRARWQRDPTGRPVRQEIWSAGDFRSAVEYKWDGDDRLRMVIHALRGPIRYEHDALGNLAAATYEDGQVDLRLPDAFGNLYQSRDRDDRRYGAAGELLESRAADGGRTTYAYDGDGNLSEKLEHSPDGAAARVWRYRWSAAGLLASVVRPDGDEVTFSYDPLGRRLSKTFRGRTTRWLWNGHVPIHEWVEVAGTTAEDAIPPTIGAEVDIRRRAAVLSERTAQGPPASPVAAPITWVFEPESFVLAAKLVSGRCYSIASDRLGTPTAMYDAAGTEVWSAALDVYGHVRAEVDSTPGDDGACPFRWPGQYEDTETGLVYNRWRYYDPDAGVFCSRDRIGLAGGLNPYRYVEDPTRFSDPLGLVPITSWNAFQQATQGWFGSRSEAATGWNVYQQSSTATNELALGRLPDTEAAEMLGMQRLNTNPWSPAINDAWVQGGIDADKTFYLASEPGPPNFFNPPGSAYPETVFKREMDQLEDAGYKRSGSCMAP